MTMRSPIPNTNIPIPKILAALIILVCFVSIISAEGESTITSSSSPLWSTFVDLCATIAPCSGVVCFLAPLPTIVQVSRDKTVGNLPLLPYSSMIANGFLWVVYGQMKNLPSVWGSNAVGVVMGAYYLTVFAKHCGPLQSNLPGTVGQHLKCVSAIMLLNLSLVASNSVANVADIIGKEGVFFCVLLFASPLAALKTVVATKSAESIPLPFTLACLVNCSAWSVMGWWKVNDFNIYFPNLLGLICAVAQLVLKGIYGNRTTGESHGTQKLPK